MLPVVDKPIIQYAVEEAAAAGIEEFIFITHHAKRAIDDHFDENHELVDALSKNNKTEFLKKIQNIGGKHAKFTFIIHICTHRFLPQKTFLTGVCSPNCTGGMQ